MNSRLHSTDVHQNSPASFRTVDQIEKFQKFTEID